MTHNADAVVVNCMDFRLQKYIRKFTDKILKSKTFDLVSFAGSTKDLKTILTQIDISVKLHHIKEVHLVHHEECGAYGKESTFNKHNKDLNRTKKAILKKHPKLNIFLYYLFLSGKYKTVK